MATVRLELTEEQARFLQQILDQRDEDTHWGKIKPDTSEREHTITILGKLRNGFCAAGIETNRTAYRC